MKRVFILLGISFLLFHCEKIFSQSFTAVFPDTIQYGPPIDGSALSCWTGDLVTNISGSPLDLDVVRVQDDTATPGWKSDFCFQTCQMPEIDSIRCTLAPSEIVNMAVHLVITATPDSGTVLMKIKNVINPAEVVYQRFYGISQLGLKANEGSAFRTNVNIYPSPVLSGNDFSMNILLAKKAGSLSLAVYNIFGGIVQSTNNLRAGNNTLNFNLAAGIYSYSLFSGSEKLTSGKLIVID
jgi:hypothetical protein